MRHISYGSRIKEETSSYDWLNNLVANADDSNGFYDRSLGTQSFANAAKPHRLTSASNRSTGSTRQGELAVAYDDVGQVTAMVLQREGTCLRSGSSCWARFAYDWDEVGNLTRARRWDLAAGTERTTYAAAASVSGAHPTRTPDAEMNYQYDGGTRVVKASTRSTGTLYTVYPFSTLELRLVGLSGSGASQDYALNTDTTQIRLGAGAVSGRVLYNAVMPRTGTSQVHLFLEFGDHLGSATFTIDHATSEVVEYISYTAYGQSENDYRTSRWSNFRESYRFTGKEDDVEVGLNYHGARYYSPALKRWMSADPVTVHEAGSDINPYSYGYGNPTSYVDPDGRFPLLLVAAIIGAVISTGAFVYSNGFHPTSGSWLAGAFVAAGSGALGGLTGGAVGVGVGLAMGAAAAGTLGGAVFIGAMSGIAGTGASYGSSWLGLTAAKGLGANVSTEGYSVGGMLQAMAIGGAVGGAIGGGVWGGVKLYNALNNGIGNAAAAAEGQAAGKAAHDAAAAAGPADEAASTATSTKPTVLDTPPAPKIPAPKPLPKVNSNTVAPGPKATVTPVEEPQPVYDPTKTGEFEQSNVTQRQPGWNREHSGSWSHNKRWVPSKAVDTLAKIDSTKAAPSGFKGGGPFTNDGRGGGQVLPQATRNGTPITYQEWDVNPFTKGVNRGVERLVTGSDGSAWFTSDHYSHFTRIR